MTTAPKTSATRGDKRDQILAAALELFAERGFHGTAVPLVAEKAGVGAGTIYRYFESKEALVNELYRHWKGAFVAYALEGFPQSSPPREQFRWFFHRIVTFACEHREAFRFLEMHHHQAYLDARSKDLEQRSLALVLGFIAQTHAMQVTKAVDPWVLVSAVWGPIVHLLKLTDAGFVGLTESVIEQAEKVCWEAIRA
ncbi:MAG: TetR/AcrR family transcriptional regulator [Sandaracinaceae bacterium]|nr:TetR/AcrR family transcriptional regulator [Sandaracinaceae bacterium]